MDVWVERELVGGAFPDQRLKARLGKLLGDFGRRVGGAVPMVCQDWAATKAAYRFFSNERVDEGIILAGHFAATTARFAVRPLRGPTPAIDPPPEGGEELAEALSGNTRTPVPAQVAFRLDFPRWRSGFGRRARAVLDALAAGGRTNEVARELGLSPARVSQMRREFERGWKAFHQPRDVG
ncbi:MAG TPA: transposase DNA-binding-containing protein [Gemmataceae bacterium]|nr:transposase DNA-binding-containing protein [Gemmataceae bacterium]